MGYRWEAQQEEEEKMTGVTEQLLLHVKKD